ncbi:fluoride efflux transporter FluC [Halomonas sp. LS-001]
MSGVLIYASVGMGSALGAGLRYVITLGALAAFGPLFPWATLGVNILGSALIVGLSCHAQNVPQGHFARWHGFWVTGLCGGFTTFSLFSLEVWWLWHNGMPWLAAAYLGASVSGWLLAAGWVHHVMMAQRKRVP